MFVGWLENHYGVPKEKLKARIQLWPGKDEWLAVGWWSEQLGIPKNNFIKSNVKKQSGKKDKARFGVCRVYLDSKGLLARILNDIDLEFGHPATY